MEFLEKIEYKYIDRLNFLSLIIGILASTVGVIGFILEYVLGVDSSSIFIFTDINFLIVTPMAFLIFMLLIRIIKYMKSINEFKKVIKDIEYVVQLYMNNNFMLVRAHNLGDLTLSYLVDNVRGVSEDILNVLCRIFKRVTGEEISACIKLLTDDSKSTKTFYRSSNAKAKREKRDLNKEVRFTKNTDFYKIIKENEEYFYVGDLEKYSKEKGNDYKNSNRDYLNYYKGTIVVPIKIENNYIHFSKDKKGGVHLLGFLCVDSLSKKAFTERQRKYNLQIMFIFANIFYMILNKYKYYLKKYEEEYYGKVEK